MSENKDMLSLECQCGCGMTDLSTPRHDEDPPNAVKIIIDSEGERTYLDSSGEKIEEEKWKKKQKS